MRCRILYCAALKETSRSSNCVFLVVDLPGCNEWIFFFFSDKKDVEKIVLFLLKQKRKLSWICTKIRLESGSVLPDESACAPICVFNSKSIGLCSAKAHGTLLLQEETQTHSATRVDRILHFNIDYFLNGPPKLPILVWALKLIWD